ncbi:OmpA family protein [Jannaschia sp. LMIT008]|uniref:OmpA family protein n=1 Tax=Jannaschia maritima TaxID=3032585 RepID=UPI002812482B|nr:OmpA family protein [Jannaschia sp. LMIT008]
MRLAAALALLASLAGRAGAVDLVLPAGAERTHAATVPLATHRVAVAPFDGETVPRRAVEGVVTRQVWRAPLPPGGTPLMVVAPLREALAADGWRVALDCEARACGGFDFRFAVDVTPAPAMFVDLNAFRYLSAVKDDAWLTVLASVSAGVAYVQATHVGPPDEDAVAAAPTGRAAAPAGAPAVAADLAARGRAILSDLTFAPGGTALTTRDYASLAMVAAFLRDDPDATVALVGHTDAEGGTEGNLAISRRRAEAVRDRLIAEHGVDPARVEARGVAYFAPLASNADAAGRALNRRVEVVVTSVGATGASPLAPDPGTPPPDSR